MLTQPDLEPINEKEYELQHDWSYEWTDVSRIPYFPKACRITILAGNITDGASVPQLFWSTGFKPDGLTRAASTIHDLLYSRRGMLYGDPHTYKYEERFGETWIEKQRLFSREQCDNMFLKIMLESGVSSWKAHTMWGAVRAFGEFAW